jgi:putative transposase
MVITLTEGASPVASMPRYQRNAMLRGEISARVQELLDADIIEPSTSPWAAPLVMVKKPDNTYRMCIDNGTLNEVTVGDRYPIPSIQGTLERMAGNSLYTTLDLRSGYHQVALDEKSRPLTAFTCADGLYQFKKVPFGLKNAPSYFQRMMHQVLQDLFGKTCEVYIDDIIIYAANKEELWSRMATVLNRLKEHNVRLKSCECKIGLTSISYLGH